MHRVICSIDSIQPETHVPLGARLEFRCLLVADPQLMFQRMRWTTDHAAVALVLADMFQGLRKTCSTQAEDMKSSRNQGWSQSNHSCRDAF